MTTIIDGKKIAATIEKSTAKAVAALKKKGITPKLAVVLVGNDKPSRTYIGRKKAAAQRAGMDFALYEFPKNISKEELIDAVHAIQKDSQLTGLIIQLPLPERLYKPDVLNAINPAIDVDCLTDANIGKLVMKSNHIEPPTPWAVIKTLKEIKFNLVGKNVTIVGAGALVGKPLAIMLVNELASVTTCNSYTKDIKKKCLEADVIVSAVGKQNLIKADMVKKGAVVIDTGIVYINGKMQGDVDFASVSKKTKFITPTPGGIGPITVAKLLLNTVTCAKKINKVE
ncbi:MAG: bifunctional 5,10-methylenetetrahydrofolate dehydrogenase/5,10-methenyltetrahydrofolate cyclohydrolase [Candidatus Magasanikbacteria bacterium]|nr:bifunctional 5,10-methylenetetrahydrofolate dehydrogenase/5,10-methenyltetrahydrofolate cyclohydrolase [Candidatus Magasanikbacteria bacterium]